MSKSDLSAAVRLLLDSLDIEGPQRIVVNLEIQPRIGRVRVFTDDRAVFTRRFDVTELEEAPAPARGRSTKKATDNG